MSDDKRTDSGIEVKEEAPRELFYEQMKIFKELGSEVKQYRWTAIGCTRRVLYEYD